MTDPTAPIRPADPPDAPTARPIILFDGLCGFCNSAIRLLLRHDRSAQLLFAPLQSALATRLLAVHGRDAAHMDSVALVLAPDTPRQQLFLGPEAVGRALAFADSPWPLLGRLILATPRWLREPVYRLIARIRYRIFGKYAACPIPTPEERARFIGF